jgi:hypothetical protein
LSIDWWQKQKCQNTNSFFLFWHWDLNSESLVFAGQMLCWLSHALSPFVFILFFPNRVLC